MNILTDEEIAELKNQHFVMDRYGEVFEFNKFARAIEVAVLKKLSDQAGEPVAYAWDSESAGLTYENHYSDTTPLYTEAQLIAAQQRTAEACAKAAHAQSKYLEGSVVAAHVKAAVMNNWREYL